MKYILKSKGRSFWVFKSNIYLEWYSRNILSGAIIIQLFFVYKIIVFLKNRLIISNSIETYYDPISIFLYKMISYFKRDYIKHERYFELRKKDFFLFSNAILFRIVIESSYTVTFN